MPPDLWRLPGDQGTSSAISYSIGPASKSRIVERQSSIPLQNISSDNDELRPDRGRTFNTDPSQSSLALVPMKLPSLRSLEANLYDSHCSQIPANRSLQHPHQSPSALVPMNQPSLRTRDANSDNSRWSHIPVDRLLQHPHQSTCHAAAALTPYQVALAGHRRSGTIDLFWKYLGVPPRMFFSENGLKQIWQWAEHLYATKIKSFEDAEVGSEEYRATCKSFREMHHLCRVDQPLRHQLALAHLTRKERKELGLQPVKYADTVLRVQTSIDQPLERRPWNSCKDVSPGLEHLCTVPYLRFQAPNVDDIFAEETEEILIQCNMRHAAECINDSLSFEERMACEFSFRGEHQKQRTYTGWQTERSYWNVQTRSSSQSAVQIHEQPSPMPNLVDISPMPQPPSEMLTPARRENYSFGLSSTHMEPSQNRQLVLYKPGDSRGQTASCNRSNHAPMGSLYLAPPMSEISRRKNAQRNPDRMLERETRLAPRRIGTDWRNVAQKANLPPRAMFDRPFNPTLREEGSTPKEIVDMPDYNLLTRGEGDFCIWNRLPPATYLDTKERLFNFFHEFCVFNSDGTTVENSYNKWTRSQAQKIRGIDANKLSRMHAFYKEMGLFERSWLTSSSSSAVQSVEN